MHILLAEDDSTSRDLMRRIIALAAAHTLVQACDGEEAWQQLRESPVPFDLCISDISMPRLDGIGLVERMRAASGLRTMPVILCTALNDRQTVERACRLSISHYIVKPYTKAVVLEKIRFIEAELATQAAVEPPLAVADRLGIDAAALPELIANFVKDMNTWLAATHRGRSPDEFRELAVNANGLRGAALSLGLRALATELEMAEAKLLSEYASDVRLQFPPTPAEISGDLAAVLGEMNRLGAETRSAA
jgi:two-component system chemotaxis response regulator CheY